MLSRLVMYDCFIIVSQHEHENVAHYVEPVQRNCNSIRLLHHIPLILYKNKTPFRINHSTTILEHIR